MNGLAQSHRRGFLGRSFSDVLLFSVTGAELILLVAQTPDFGAVDYIYVVQHLMVLTAAITRGLPQAQDRSLPTYAAVAVSYAYPYGQVIYLNWMPGVAAWPGAGFALVVVAAALSFVSLLTLGRLFGVRPALRGLATSGPYRLVRHPMYLAYVLGDIGYNLEEWNIGTVLMVLAGWAALVYRIRAEERILQEAGAGLVTPPRCVTGSYPSFGSVVPKVCALHLSAANSWRSGLEAAFSTLLPRMSDTLTGPP